MFDSSFEIKLSQLADARLQEMVPSLNEDKVGFQLIDKNEDDTKGVGVMAFLLNNTWVYIPVFFLSGKLKMPCLYIKDYDMRVPLNDSWVSSIKSDDIAKLGRLVDTGSVRVNQSKADLMNLIGKQSSEKNDLITPAEIKTMLSSTPCGETSLMDALAMDKKAFITVVDEMSRNDDFANALFRYYSPSDFRKTASLADAAAEAEETARLMSVEIPPLRTLTKESEEAKSLKDNEKAELMRDGYFLKDDRMDTSIVYRRENKMSSGFSSPMGPGFYDVLMEDGSVKECVIVFPQDFWDRPYPNDASTRRTLSLCSIIPKDNPTKYVTARIPDVLTRNRREVDQSGVKGAQVSIQNDLNRAKLAKMRTDTIMLVDSFGNAFSLDKDRDWPMIHFTDKKGKLHVRNGTLMIPNDVLVFKKADSFDGASDLNINLGDLNTFVIKCGQVAETSPLKIYHNNSDGYYVTSKKADKGSLKKKAALELLTYTHGVNVDEARVMLKEAADHGAAPKTVRYMIKYAGTMNLSTDMGTVGRSISNPTESNEVVAPSTMTDMAMKASDTGLKEVLDTSVIASLIGTSRSMGKIGDFIPDLIKTLDRLGSILCLFYWDNDSFKEQYGSVELVELEDKLIDVFGSLGDVTLFLKEKSTDSGSLFDGDKGNISEDIGEDM